MTEPYCRSRKTGPVDTYHTRDDCPRGEMIENRITVDPSERPSLSECEWCTGYEPNEDRDWSYYRLATNHEPESIEEIVDQ